MAYYKKKFSLETRINESKKIKTIYPDRVPVLCFKNPVSKETPKIDKRKYLVPRDLTMGQFVFIIRKRLKIKPEEALFFFIGNDLAPTSKLFTELYEQYQDEDGFLYIQYTLENTFG